MPTFFHGWRRKIGVATLVMACGVMACWVKTASGDREWCLQVPRFPVLNHFWIARRGFGWRTQVESGDAKNSLRFEWRRIVSINSPSDFMSSPKLQGEVIGGFRFDESTDELPTGNRYFTQVWIVPYWSIVIPLTMLSAYLMLSKRKSKTVPETTEPKNEPTVTHE